MENRTTVKNQFEIGDDTEKMDLSFTSDDNYGNQIYENLVSSARKP